MAITSVIEQMRQLIQLIAKHNHAYYVMDQPTISDSEYDHLFNSTFTVFENELFPSPVPSEAINLSISTVDIQLVGYTPNVIGFGGPFDQNTGNGYEPDGSATE
ncbi:hypothetical protein ACFMJX_02960, partial [Acinetobacter baumannii]